MLPLSLLEETIARADGVGPPLEVNRACGQLLVLTLGITRIVEQVSLQVSIWGSPDGRNWGSEPLTAFPQKAYCGLYSRVLNLSASPDIRWLRVEWKMNRRRNPGPAPLFGFFVEAEESGARVQPRHETAAAIEMAVA